MKGRVEAVGWREPQEVTGSSPAKWDQPCDRGDRPLKGRGCSTLLLLQPCTCILTHDKKPFGRRCTGLGGLCLLQHLPSDRTRCPLSPSILLKVEKPVECMNTTNSPCSFCPFQLGLLLPALLPGANIRLLSVCPSGLSPVHTLVLIICSNQIFFPLNVIIDQDKLHHNPLH